MLNRNTPLKALHYFESVARNGSFKIAAAELHVTPPAISQQIKVLEDSLGIELFQRASKKAYLTDQGKILFQGVQSSFDILSFTLDQLVNSTRHIRIRTTSSFYSLWLIPKISEYESRNPGADIRVSTDIENHSYDSAHDIEIIYTPGPFDKLNNSLFVIPETLIPVCTPEYKTRKEPSLQSLSSHRLILNSPEGYDWIKWAEDTGIDADVMINLTKQGMKMISDASAIEVIMSGIGIGLANTAYVKPYLASGRLIAAFDTPPFELGCHYGRLFTQKSNREVAHFASYLANCATN